MSSLPEFHLDKLCCLETGALLQEADEPLISTVNQRIEQGLLRDQLGRVVEAPIESGLVDKESTFLYPVVNGAIQMVREETIPLSQLRTIPEPIFKP